jgi:hypothetical protein
VCAGAVAALLGMAPITAGASSAAVSPGKLKITEEGFLAERDDPESWIDVNAAATLTNPTGKVAVDVYYAVRVTDTKGKLLEERDNQHLAYVLPDVETYLVQDIDLFDAGPNDEVGDVTFKVTDIDELVALDKWTSSDGKPETSVPVADILEFSDLSVQQTDFVFDVVHGLVTNTSTELLSGSPFAVQVSCALYRGGELVGGGYDQISVLPPGTPVALMHKVPLTMDPDEIRCSGEVGGLQVHEVGSDADQFEVLTAAVTPGALDDLHMAARIGTTAETIPVDVTADWEFLDAGGRVIGSAFESFDLPYLLPGEELTVGGSPESPEFLDGIAASVVVRVAANEYLSPADFEDRFGFAPDEAPLTVTEVEHSRDGPIVTVTGTIESSSKTDFDEVHVHCGLYAGSTPTGVVVALDVPVPARGSAPFSADTSAPGDITEVQCVALAEESF